MTHKTKSLKERAKPEAKIETLGPEVVKDGGPLDKDMTSLDTLIAGVEKTLTSTRDRYFYMPSACGNVKKKLNETLLALTTTHNVLIEKRNALMIARSLLIMC